LVHGASQAPELNTENSKELLQFHQAVAYLNHVELTLTLPHLLPEIKILNLNPEARKRIVIFLL
jgi:hypothetical protein